MSKLKEMLEKNRLESYQKFKDFLYALKPSYPHYGESGIKGEKYPASIEVKVVYTNDRSGPTKEGVPYRVILTLIYINEYGWPLPREDVSYLIEGVSEVDLLSFLRGEMEFKPTPIPEKGALCFAL